MQSKARRNALLPRFCLGTPCLRGSASRTRRSQGEPGGVVFPGGAWERVCVWSVGVSIFVPYASVLEVRGPGAEMSPNVRFCHLRKRFLPSGWSPANLSSARSIPSHGPGEPRFGPEHPSLRRPAEVSRLRLRELASIGHLCRLHP